MSRICILGASGLIGATLVERLINQGEHDVVPVINSAGSAWRLTRHDLPLIQANLSDIDATNKAIDGADIVVNCARIPENQVVKATNNLIDSCSRYGVQRLIHLSSVAVYGESPALDSASEDAAVNPAKGSYGDYKARQDRLIQKACVQGRLGASVLCIPNISGPYSNYMLLILASLGSRSFALVDEGQHPVMLCDVNNICHAIELAFQSDQLDGSRTFIMDGGETNWKQLTERLAPLIGHELPLPNLSRNAALHNLESGPRGIRGALGTARQLAHLPGVKKTIKQNASLTKSLIKWHSRISHLPGGMQGRATGLLSGNGGSTPQSPRPESVTRSPINVGFLKHQLRDVRHLNTKAELTLGYSPEVTFEQSMDAFTRWYKTMHGYSGPSAALLADLDDQYWRQ